MSPVRVGHSYGDNWLDCTKPKGLLCPLLDWDYRDWEQLPELHKAKRTIMSSFRAGLQRLETIGSTAQSQNDYDVPC
jgi:hypothetical protein